MLENLSYKVGNFYFYLTKLAHFHESAQLLNEPCSYELSLHAKVCLGQLVDQLQG